jgi:polar amino acid transport system substrate-binding protein
VKGTIMRKLSISLAITGTLLLAACGGSSSSSDTTAAASSGTGNECTSGKTLTADTLTIGTGNPAYSPWVENDKPESKEGFEAAVAYAVAAELGFGDAAVTWVRTGFDEAVQPGKKNFDFNLQQFSINDERKKTVSFSASYYSTNQAVVALAGSPAIGATTVADLADVKFGAQAGTTSLDFITNVIKPSAEPFAYDDNAGAKAALEAKQIDAIVVDLPTAFYIAAVELTGASVVGQFPASTSTTPDNFGLVFDLNNPLVECVDTALAALKDNGTLAEIEKTWLADKTNAPVIAVS